MPGADGPLMNSLRRQPVLLAVHTSISVLSENRWAASRERRTYQEPLRSLRSADPLCMARWSVVSLLIRYCGSFFDARTVYPLNLIGALIFRRIVQLTRPASELRL